MNLQALYIIGGAVIEAVIETVIETVIEILYLSPPQPRQENRREKTTRGNRQGIQPERTGEDPPHIAHQIVGQSMPNRLN